jgi:hypothetical protein
MSNHLIIASSGASGKNLRAIGKSFLWIFLTVFFGLLLEIFLMLATTWIGEGELAELEKQGFVKKDGDTPGNWQIYPSIFLSFVTEQSGQTLRDIVGLV